MQDQQRIMIIDDAGILRFDLSTKKDPYNLPSITNSLFSGMITAINAISHELGGNLQILVIGTEKLASRSLDLKGNRVIVIVADAYNCRDDLLLLKTEIVSRKLLQTIERSDEDIINSKIKFSKLKSILRQTEYHNFLTTTVMSDSPKYLLKTLTTLPSQHQHLENMINLLAQELPSIDLISDPGLIIVNTMIIVPFNFDDITRARLVKHIKTVIEPLVGSRFVSKLIDRFSISDDWEQ